MTSDLSRKLTSEDPVNFFAYNCEKTIPDWLSLLRDTTLPSIIPSSDPQYITAFKAVGSVIAGEQTTYLLLRLAHVQEMRLFDCLRAKIRSERVQGLHRHSGVGDVTIAINIYKSAQEKYPDIQDLDGFVRERRRTGRRLVEFSGRSPLFLLLYSAVLEKVIHRSSGMSETAIKHLASSVQQNCPTGLVNVCIRLEEIVQTAVDSGQSTRWQDVITQARDYLISMQTVK
ncbi:hypothetical protein V8F33_013920 [Rhypophila sp. PSN 637]